MKFIEGSEGVVASSGSTSGLNSRDLEAANAFHSGFFLFSWRCGLQYQQLTASFHNIFPRRINIPHAFLLVRPSDSLPVEPFGVYVPLSRRSLKKYKTRRKLDVECEFTREIYRRDTARDGSLIATSSDLTDLFPSGIDSVTGMR